MGFVEFKIIRKFCKIVDYQSRNEITPPTKDFVLDLFKDDGNIELWLYLDQILLELSGQDLTWTELLKYYQANHTNIIKHVLPET